MRRRVEDGRPAGIIVPCDRRRRGLKQVAYLKGSNTKAGDHFGCGGVLDGHAGYGAAMSGDGNTLAIGAPHESGGAKGVNGKGGGEVRIGRSIRVHQKRRHLGTAGLHKGVQSSDERRVRPCRCAQRGRQHDGRFGIGKRAAATGVTRDQRDESIPQAGAVYVFTRMGTTWTQQAYIKASNTGEAGTEERFGDGDQFGVSIALSDDGRTLAVGAISEDSNAAGINGDQANNSATSAGAVYVFARSGNTWAQQAYVKAANPDPGDLFGYSVALSADGNTMAVGSYDEGGSSRTINGPVDNMRRGAGAVYVFTRTGGTWAQQATFTPPTRKAEIHSVSWSCSATTATRCCRRRSTRIVSPRASTLRDATTTRRPIAGRRRLHLRAQRQHVVRTGIHQGLEQRSERLVRLALGAERRWQHGGVRRLARGQLGPRCGRQAG